MAVSPLAVPSAGARMGLRPPQRPDRHPRSSPDRRMTRHNDSRAATPRRRWSPQVTTGLVLAALAIVFVVENTQLVGIRLFIPVVTMPLWTALAAVLFIGVVIGFLVRRSRR